MDIISKSTLETKKLGREVASKLKGGEVICLYGDLGAGKTVFVSGMMDFFLPKKRILSPTFIIVRHYQITNNIIKNIFHIDLYRMERKTEIDGLGLNEFINKTDNLVLIEWADKMGKELPENRIEVKFKIISDEKRKIEIYNY